MGQPSKQSPLQASSRGGPAQAQQRENNPSHELGSPIGSDLGRNTSEVERLKPDEGRRGVGVSDGVAAYLQKEVKAEG